MRHNRWRATKNYQFNGQVVATCKNGVLTYLHGDHLGSTIATSNSSGSFSGQERYHAYGRFRGGHELGTENRDPKQQGAIQEQRLRDMLSRTYNQTFGTTDAEIRKGLGISGKTADFLGFNAQQNRWLIAESKGADLDKAYNQLTNTAQGLLSKVPEAVGNIELRIYMNATQYNKLTEGLLPGWRTNNGYLGWLDEFDQFVYAVINGAKVLVQGAQ